MVKTTVAILALCLAGGAAYAQDKKKPAKDEDPGSILKEVDQRLKAQSEDLLRAFGKMLDERLGKTQKPAEKKEEPRKAVAAGKKPDEKKGDDRVALLKEVDKRLKAQREEILRAVEKLLDSRLGRGHKMDEESRPGKKGPGMHAQNLPPGLARKFAAQRGKPGPEDKRGKKKGKKDDD